MRKLTVAVLGSFVLVSACAPPPLLLPDRPLTAVEQCRIDVARKRQQCRTCWGWSIVPPFFLGFLCYGGCGGAADALERQCNAAAFAAESHPTRIEADITTRQAPPR